MYYLPVRMLENRLNMLIIQAKLIRNSQGSQQVIILSFPDLSSLPRYKSELVFTDDPMNLLPAIRQGIDLAMQ